MARNKVIDRHRREKVRRPVDDGNHVAAAGTAEPVDPADSPSQIVEGRELMSIVRARLSEDEIQIAAFRQQGLSWPAIGNRMNSTGEAVRKRMDRACQRVLAEIGIIDDDSE